MLSRRSVSTLRVLFAFAAIAAVAPVARGFVADALVARASTYAVVGKPDDSARYLRRAIWVDRDAPAVGSEVAFLAGTTNDGAARNRYSALAYQYVVSHPSDVDAWESLLVAEFRANDARMARLAAVNVLRLGPTSTASARLATNVLRRR